MISTRDAFVHTTARWLDEDPRLALVLADIGEQRFADLGVFERHPGRAINVGIREALAVGAAAGLAMEGLLPIVHTYAPFLVERAFEQVKLDLVHQDLSAILVSIGASFDAAIEGRTHQAPGDVALLGTLPDLRIELPGHPDEVEGALERARNRSRGTSYVRLSELANPEAFGGGLHRLRSGRRGTVLAIGPTLGPVLEAVRDLELGVLYTPTALPIDPGLGQAVAPREPLAVVEPVLEGTSLAPVLEVLEPGARSLRPIGVKRRELRSYGDPADHLRAHGLDALGLRARLRAWLG